MIGIPNFIVVPMFDLISKICDSCEISLATDVIIDELAVLKAQACGGGRHRPRDGNRDFKMEDKSDIL